MKKIFIIFLIFNSFSFGKIPQRAVSVSQFTTEILLAIGAENQMVGTSYLDTPILAKYEEKFNKIPILAKKFPTKEQFYLVKPDFVTGWEALEKPKNLGSKKELEKNGVQIFLFKSLNNENINTLYTDILKLGEIFNLKKNAEKVVKNLKKELKEISEKIPNTKKRILICDPGDIKPFVAGGKGIANYIIELVGGENITKDINKCWGYSTWEKIIVENPEYILIVDYGDKSYKSKVNFLKNESPIKTLKAVKENKFIKVNLAGISPGIRIGLEAKKLAEKLYKIKF